MQIMFKLPLVLFLMLLTGCTPTVFGVPQDEWNHLSPQQQNLIIESYNKRQQTEAENAPAMAAIGAASSFLNSYNKKGTDYNGDKNLFKPNYQATGFPAVNDQNLNAFDQQDPVFKMNKELPF